MTAPPYVHAIAGAIGSTSAMSLFFPLNNASLRLQVDKNHENPKYKGAIDCIQKIYEAEGLSGVYQGLNSAIFGIGVSSAVYYYFYELLKAWHMQGKDPRSMSSLLNLLIASEAGCLNVVLTNPLWVANTRLTTQKKQGNKSGSIVGCIQEIVAESGLNGLWKGVTPALMLVCNPSIQFVLYERLKLILEKRYNTKQLSGFQFFIIGAIAKAIASTLTYPLLSIKSRLHVSTDGGEHQYKGVFDTFQKILAEEGFKGFFKGIQSKILQSVLAAAFLFLIKEKIVYYTVRAYSLAKKPKQVV